jgi:hypothetical protein
MVVRAVAGELDRTRVRMSWGRNAATTRGEPWAGQSGEGRKAARCHDQQRGGDGRRRDHEARAREAAGGERVRESREEDPITERKTASKERNDAVEDLQTAPEASAKTGAGAERAISRASWPRRGGAHGRRRAAYHP